MWLCFNVHFAVKVGLRTTVGKTHEITKLEGSWKRLQKESRQDKGRGEKYPYCRNERGEHFKECGVTGRCVKQKVAHG